MIIYFFLLMYFLRFCLHNIYVYYVYINTHTYIYILFLAYVFIYYFMFDCQIIGNVSVIPFSLIVCSNYVPYCLYI